MKLEYDVVPLETLHPFHIARAAAPPKRYAVHVRLRDADGVVGTGEAAPSAFYGETAETVTARPGWGSLSAVEDGSIFGLDSDIASRWGPRIVEFAQSISAALEEYVSED